MVFDEFSQMAGVQPITKPEPSLQELQYPEIAVKILQMTETDGWKEVELLLEKLEKENNLSPEYYSFDPKLAHVHTGALYAVKCIRDLVQKANLFIKQKDYEQAQKNAS